MSQTKDRITITVDPQVRAYVERLVEAGRATSVSAAFNEAMTERISRDRGYVPLQKAKVAQADADPAIRAKVDRMTAYVDEQLARFTSEDTATMPLVLDTSVLIEIARGDIGLMALVQGYDANGQAMVMSTLAVAAASLDTRSEESADLLTGLELLAGMTVAPLSGVGQAVKLADVIARTDLDPRDAHVAAVADAATCPILHARRREVRRGASAELDQPLPVSGDR